MVLLFLALVGCDSSSGTEIGTTVDYCVAAREYWCACPEVDGDPDTLACGATDEERHTACENEVAAQTDEFGAAYVEAYWPCIAEVCPSDWEESGCSDA